MIGSVDTLPNPTEKYLGITVLYSEDGLFYKCIFNGEGHEWVETPPPVRIDDELSTESENPVQNKVVAQAV